MHNSVNNHNAIGTAAGRRYGLDVLRALAYLFVFVAHSIDFFRTTVPYSRNLFFLIKDAIEVFFVVSGFLIGVQFFNAVLHNNGLNRFIILDFFKRRWFKTLPSYYLVILIHVLVGLFIYPALLRDFSWKFLLFLQNFSNAGFYFFPVSYSLAIEEWFYISLPVVFALLLFVFKKRIGIGNCILLYALLFIGGATFSRLYLYYYQHADWDAVLRRAIIARFDAPVYGVLMAWMFYYGKVYFERYARVFFVAGCLLVFGCIWARQYLPDNVVSAVFYFNMVPAGLALTIPWFYYLKVNSAGFRRAVVYLSLTSYSFYLIHHTPVLFTFLHFLQPVTVMASVIGWAGYSILVFALTHMLYTYFEKPVMDLRDKI